MTWLLSHLNFEGNLTTRAFKQTAFEFHKCAFKANCFRVLPFSFKRNWVLVSFFFPLRLKKRQEDMSESGPEGEADGDDDVDDGATEAETELESEAESSKLMCGSVCSSTGSC